MYPAYETLVGDEEQTGLFWGKGASYVTLTGFKSLMASYSNEINRTVRSVAVAIEPSVWITALDSRLKGFWESRDSRDSRDFRMGTKEPDVLVLSTVYPIRN